MCPSIIGRNPIAFFMIPVQDFLKLTIHAVGLYAKTILTRNLETQVGMILTGTFILLAR